MTDSFQPENQIAFICGQCGRQNFAPVSQAGLAGTCACGAVFIVPFPQVPAPLDTTETPPSGIGAIPGPPIQAHSDQQLTPSGPLKSGQLEENLLDDEVDEAEEEARKERKEKIEEEKRESAERHKKILRNVRIIGVIGSALLIIGVFFPFFTIADKEFAYFGQDKTDRLFILLMGIASIVVFFSLRSSKITWNFAPFIIAFLILGYDIFDWKDSEEKMGVAKDVIEPSWGFAVVLVGFVLGSIASFMSRVLIIERVVTTKKGKSISVPGRYAEPEREARSRRKGRRGRRRR